MTDDEKPPGQHMDREGRYELTGLTTQQRDELILKWSQKPYKWTQRKIAAKLGITQPAVTYALKRIQNKPRNRTKYDVCDWCGESVPADQVKDGLCAECEGEL